MNLTGLSTILQLLTDTANKDKIDRGKSGANETNLSKLSMSKKSTGADHLTSKDAKKGGSNMPKGVKAAKGSNYLIPDAKKAFNHLRHTFT